MHSRRSLTLAIVGALFLVSVAAAGSLLAIDEYAPRDHLVNGRRIWRCWALGGGWPGEIDERVGLDPGHSFAGFGRVVSDKPRTALVVARLRDPSGRLLGLGVWNVGDEIPPEEFGAVDGLARQHSARDSSLDPRAHRHVLAAAQECLERGLPR